MNVLSLFDGMSCGQLGLKKSGIKYDKYFASEIDKHAIKVTQDNFPNTIQLGDVTQVRGEDLPPIDLLIGGSPCQGFSHSGKKLNFNDPRSKLFFEFVRLLKELNPRYFLLENVKMKKEFEEVITQHLGVDPILINSSLVSAQNRPRLYWTNIPNLTQPLDKGLVIRDILDTNSSNYEYVDISKSKNNKKTKNYLQYDMSGKNHNSQGMRAYYLDNKSACLTTNGIGKIIDDNGRVRKLTRNECERLQNVPDDYTKSVSVTQAKKMLGNGWTIDVITHIFGEMK